MPTLTNGHIRKEKLIKDTVSLIKLRNQMDLRDIYRALHPKPNEYTFFSSPHGTFSKINHIIRHKTNLNR
jgi:exonuclease III